MSQGYLAKLLCAAAKPDRVVVKIDTSPRKWPGMSRGRRPSDFDPTQLRRGTKIELEHVRNKLIAQRIAMDHLTEDVRYYQKLAKVHHNSARHPLTPHWRPSLKRTSTWEETCLEKHTRQGLTQRQAFMKCLRELQAKQGVKRLREQVERSPNRAERTKETIHGYPVGSDFGYYVKKVARAIASHGAAPDLVDAVMQNCAHHIRDAYQMGHDPETAAQWAINNCTTIMGRLRPQYKQPKTFSRCASRSRLPGYRDFGAVTKPRKLGRPPKHWLERCMKAVAREGTTRPSLGGPAAICANNWYHLMGEARRKDIIAEARALEAKRRAARRVAKTRANKQTTLFGARAKKPVCVKRWQKLVPSLTAHAALRMCEMVGSPLQRTRRASRSSYMAGKVPKELQDAEAAAVMAGWRIEVTGGNHLKWIPPDKTKPIIITSSTPSDVRARKNIIASLRRSGLDIARVA